MSGWLCLACHGLGVVQPIDQLAAYLNARTPVGIHFETVGNADPQLEQSQIIQRVAKAKSEGAKVIFVGHSKGAMLAYGIAVYSPELTVAIDPTCWGSNINSDIWNLAPRSPGKWQAHGSGRFINFHQTHYPGGGQLANPGPNRVDHFLPDTDHMSIVNDPRVREIILRAVTEAAK